jgi:hypothetical protein
MTYGPSGGLFGIDQEVVTLSSTPSQTEDPRWERRKRIRRRSAACGPFGELRVPARPNAGRELLQTHHELRSTQSNRSKSQPPHLVYGYNYDYQNLSSDHLLSGVVRE